jgi:arylformamidase
MRILDISLPLSESLVVWPQDPPIQITQPRHYDQGDHVIVSRLDLGAHSGTHVDAPAHFVPGGALLESIPLERFVGPARVVHIAQDVELITPAVLEAMVIPQGSERVLFRTRNSQRWAEGHADFDEQFVAINEAGARWLIERGAQLVGIDYLSVAPYANTGPTHRAFLQAGVVLLEGLNLAAADAGVYQLVCLPLRIAGVEGAPARAILIR